MCDLSPPTSRILKCVAFDQVMHENAYLNEEWVCDVARRRNPPKGGWDTGVSGLVPVGLTVEPYLGPLGASFEKRVERCSTLMHNLINFQATLM
jgi:hypothetical protein